MHRITVMAAGLIAGLCALSLACDPGCFEYKDVCACDRVAEKAPPVVPGDEKPPKSGMPAWQAEGVHAITPASMTADDEKQDREKAAAEFQGKVAAGIPTAGVTSR